MFAKQFRLLGKDVNYIVKHRTVFHTQHFSMFYIPQYPNKKYNQISFHIPLKLHASSVVRHAIKRQLVAYLENTHVSTISFAEKFYKVFIICNKKNLPDMVEEILSLGIYPFVQNMQKYFIEERNTFTKMKLSK